MSNQDEELKELSKVQVEAEVDDTLVDRFLGLDNDNGLNREEISVTQKPKKITFDKPKARVSENTVEVAKNTSVDNDPTIVEDYTAQEITETEILTNKIAQMEEAIRVLMRGRDGVKLTNQQVPKPKPVDWNKMTELQVFDLDVPIETFGHDLPDYMNVKLKDNNFSLRWVQKMPRRLGPMKAKGFTFVRKEDIEGELNIAIEEDENGVIRFDDVILMKIPKQQYFGMLRANHERALKMVDPKAAHKTAAARVINDMKSSEDGAGAYDKYAGAKKLAVFTPGYEI